MARRRRRVKIMSSSRLFALLLINLLLLASYAVAQLQTLEHLSEQSHLNQRHHLSDINLDSSDQERFQQQTHQHPHSHPYHHQNSATANSHGVVPSLPGAPSVAHLCSLLPVSTGKHLKLCKLISHSAGADEAVALGTTRGLSECRNQFKAERWNCTHAHGDHHLLTSKLAQSVGNRESGFVQAIAAAGIVHSIATACSAGTLSDCACDKTRVGLIRQKDQIWKWGGCSNNIRHGMMFAKHLVELLDAVHQHARSLSGEHLTTPTTSNSAVWPHGHQGSFPKHYKNHISNSRQQQQQHNHNYHHHQQRKRLSKRSLTSLHREPNQVVGGARIRIHSDPENAPPMLSFCQRNQNISQTAHYELIKSLLARNSLERHQDFRLAMNMHNNKVGRMAVAKNMEIKCRCHGLSGSCSLKTCWLKLSDFGQVGAYLKKKYENSVHLPTAVNVNKLIPMMDRNEISAILSGSGRPPAGPLEAIAMAPTSASAQQTTTAGSSRSHHNNHHQLQHANQATDSAQSLSVPAPEFAPLVAASAPSSPLIIGASTLTGIAAGPVSPSNGASSISLLSAPPGGALSSVVRLTSGAGGASSGGSTVELTGPINAPSSMHYNYYERHKQLEQATSGSQSMAQTQAAAASAVPTTLSFNQTQQQKSTDLSSTFQNPSSISSISGKSSEHQKMDSTHSSDDIPVNITPMTQQQYQTLIREMKLCNSLQQQQQQHSNSAPTTTGYLTTRDLHHQLEPHQQQVLSNNMKQLHKKQALHNNNNLIGNNQQLRSTSIHLSQLLHTNNKDDLIHLHKSPDYCDADPKHGFAGVQARVCSDNPLAPDSCDKLCCGRGHEARESQLKYNCDCKFQYCCKIHCKVCHKRIVEFVCK